MLLLTPLPLFHHGVVPIGCTPSWATPTWVLTTDWSYCILYSFLNITHTTSITDLAQIWPVVCPFGSWLELSKMGTASNVFSQISPLQPPTLTSNINPIQLTVHYRFRKNFGLLFRCLCWYYKTGILIQRVIKRARVKKIIDTS